jgi:hypothetical protein
VKERTIAIRNVAFARGGTEQHFQEVFDNEVTYKWRISQLDGFYRFPGESKYTTYVNN